MSFLYPTKTIPNQYDVASTEIPEYSNDAASTAWISSVDDFENQLWGQFDSGYHLSSHPDLRVHTNQPSHYGDGATSETIPSPSSQSSSSSTSPALDLKPQYFTISAGDKKKRRRIQNRDSQRAYRERTRQKESEMTSVIVKLQGEIEQLRTQEKSSGEIIQALSEEIERLRSVGQAFQWNGI